MRSCVRLGVVVTAVVSPVAAQTPGYWQQEVHYEIQARVDETTGVLSGRESVTYVNRSPDTLTVLNFHLYLNAFRPGSRWADRDSAEGRRRFNDLDDPDYAFERIRGSTIDGSPVVPEYPYAPDSTIVRFQLPVPLPPGRSLDAEIVWDARPSTFPRRQARRGRRFDFAQWYPRVVTYDRDGWQDHPLYPAGEFYGEFGIYDVTLDVAEDQVIGATGVPVEGDPGWEHAAADPTQTVAYQREFYGSGAVSERGCGAMQVERGRKCVRFRAEDVHHFAMSLNPAYRYEQGRFEDVVVRVLYTPDDVATWGNGVAVGRTVEALRWLDELFGPYPWPQITNVHRIEGGGTEFPMMVMDGSASMGLILHEVGHNYLMGVLANNEWREAFLDEGFTSFQTAWYFEEHTPGFDGYASLEANMLALDLEALSQPVSMVSDAFRDFATYNAMVYSKAQLFYHQLRYILGHDVMKAVLREYYRRWRLKHVTEAAFREVAEEVSGMRLDWFFDQWLRETPLIDYAIGEVRRRELSNGRWETRVEIHRREEGRMPIEVGERRADRALVYARAMGDRTTEIVRFETAEPPGRLMIDPRVRSHDWNFTNNRERSSPLVGTDRWRFDTFVSEPSLRDGAVRLVGPTVWWSDASDATLGVRFRQNYMGRYNRWSVWLHRGVSGIRTSTGDIPVGFRLRFANPVFLRAPGASQAVEGWSEDGTVGARAQVAWVRRPSLGSSRVRGTGYELQWVATREMDYLDPERWDNAGTVEAGRWDAWEFSGIGARWKLRFDVRAGAVYTKVGSRIADPEPYGRVTGSLSARKPLAGFSVNGRLFAGGYVAESRPPLQRAIPAAGADPYQTLGNPFLRTVGAPLARDDVFYQAPGNGNLRGYSPDVGGRWLVAGNLELERDLVRRGSGVFRGLSVLLFGDGAIVDTLAVPSNQGRAWKPLYDAGAGVRATLHVGDLTFPLRIEFPFWVTDPLVAHDVSPGRNRWGFRWLVSLQPIF